MNLSPRFNWTLIDQALVSGVNFATGLLLARMLGLEAFGQFTVLWMGVLFAGSFQMALILSPMMSIGPLQPAEEEPAYYGAVMIQQFVFSMVCFIAAGLALLVLDGRFPSWNLGALALPLCLTLVACQLQELLRRYFFTVGRVKAALLNDGISYLGQLACLLALMFLPGEREQLSLSPVLWIIAGTSGLAGAVGFCLLGPLKIEEESLREVNRRHWMFSKWLVASTLMQWLSGNYLILSAGLWLGASAIGALKACQNIVGVAHILFNAFSNLVPLRLGRLLARKGLDALEADFCRISLLGGGATLALMLPALLFPDILLDLLYGAEFSGFGWILAAYVPVYLLAFGIQQMTFILKTLEETRPIFVGYLVAGLASVLLAYPLIRFFQVGGVMTGLILLNALNLSLLVTGYLRKRKDLRQIRDNPPPTVVSEAGCP